MARILVVDDEPDERFLVGRTLTRAGHEVIVAGDGAAAGVLVMLQQALLPSRERWRCWVWRVSVMLGVEVDWVIEIPSR